MLNHCASDTIDSGIVFVFAFDTMPCGMALVASFEISTLVFSLHLLWPKATSDSLPACHCTLLGGE